MELALTKRNSVWSVVQIVRLIPSFLFLFPAPFKMKFCEVLNTQGLFTCLCWASEFRACGRCQMGSGRDRRSLCAPQAAALCFPNCADPQVRGWFWHPFHPYLMGESENSSWCATAQHGVQMLLIFHHPLRQTSLLSRKGTAGTALLGLLKKKINPQTKTQPEGKSPIMNFPFNPEWLETTDIKLSFW